MRKSVVGLFGVIVLVWMSACSTVPVNTPVKVVLTPVHKYSALKPKPKKIPGIRESDIGDSNLLDNDGNEYWQYWDLREKNRSEFRGVVEKCNGAVNKSKIQYNQRALTDINISDIKPSLYKKYVNCIINDGFEYVYGDGFSPVKYRMMISRGVKKYGKYVSLRGEFYLIKKGVYYQDVVKHVKACEKQIQNSKRKGVKDEYFRGYISVSIEPYAKFMMSCLGEYSYTIVPLTNMKPGNSEITDNSESEKSKSRKDSHFLINYK